ncbi:cupin domain-containing protein [Catelliglobosispora koreensis]|uniref:cupin domain-containing protein n=1 Tax=Catelliglobosispora koreensis TaxID=129052 RepID=UPI0003770004|nr:cupin domain-containing protein [Catelliglobosispora koreensis]
MTTGEVKSFDKPDEVRPFEGKGHADLLHLGGKAVARGTFEPGWRWSANVKPIVKTELCEFSHLGYVVSGRMRVTMKDGTELEMSEGEAAAIPPGHDAEVVGDEPVVFLDFGEIDEYALRK